MIAAYPLRQIAVIGAGLAGRAFALRCVAAGFRVTLEDVMPEKLRRAEDEYTALCPLDHKGSLGLVTTVEDAVRDADLAVDFVPDELESKLEIFSLLDRMAPPHTLLLTPTETQSVTDLASCTYRPELCLGARGTFNGAGIVLVRGRQTREATVQSVQQFLEAIGMHIEMGEDFVEPLLTKNGAAAR